MISEAHSVCSGFIMSNVIIPFFSCIQYYSASGPAPSGLVDFAGFPSCQARFSGAPPWLNQCVGLTFSQIMLRCYQICHLRRNICRVRLDLRTSRFWKFRLIFIALSNTFAHCSAQAAYTEQHLQYDRKPICGIVLEFSYHLSPNTTHRLWQEWCMLRDSKHNHLL